MITRTLARLNVSLTASALLLAAIGCVLVYSATHFGSEASLFSRQILWTTVGIILMIIFTAIDYHVLLDISPFLYGVGLVLLTYVLIWGRFTRNVKSWIHIGSFQFQPAEFAKIFTALLIAHYFESNDRVYLNFKDLFMIGAMIGAPVLLIAIQPAFGSAAAFTPLVAIAMIFGGVRPKHWVVAILILAILLPLAWMSLKPFQKERIETFIDPSRDPLGSGYQVIQAKIAIGSGGITGKGFLRGTQVNLEYLPARHTDFIFAVLGEEWGFVGVTIVLALYLYFIVESLSTAKHARDRGGTFLVLSLVAFFAFHIVINVGMQVGLLPVTGIPLPLLSYGGSQTMMFLVAVGLILNVDMRRFVNVNV